MGNINIESTNGGSHQDKDIAYQTEKVKLVGGQTVIDASQNELKVPTGASRVVTCSDKGEDYITLQLVARVLEQPNR